MKFRNYCLILMGKNFTRDSVVSEITKISEITPNYIDAVGIMIVTFTSVLEPSELDENFKTLGWNFMVFDLDSKSSAVKLINPDLHEGLFGFLRDNQKDKLDDMSVRLMKDIALSSDTKSQWSPPANENRSRVVKKSKKEEDLTEADVEKMTKDQRQKKLDEYIDFGKKNGFEKLTDLDKKIMELLAK